MKQLFTMIGALAAIAQAASGAAVYVPGTLATYVALTGGCMIGNDTFTNFSILSGQTGSVAFLPGAVSITPSGGTTNPALTFTAIAPSSPLLEAIFSYRIFGSTFTGSSIALSGSASDSFPTHIQNLCGGGTFGPDGVSNCGGTTFGPLVAAFTGGTDMAAFRAPSSLTVTDDYTINPGAGLTSGGTFTDRFTATSPSAVPEPGTIVITALGSALLFALKNRSKEIL